MRRQLNMLQSDLLDQIGPYRIVKTWGTGEDYHKIIYIPLKFCCGSKYSLAAAQARIYRQLYSVPMHRDLKLQG